MLFKVFLCINFISNRGNSNGLMLKLQMSLLGIQSSHKHFYCQINAENSDKYCDDKIGLHYNCLLFVRLPTVPYLLCTVQCTIELGPKVLQSILLYESHHTVFF